MTEAAGPSPRLPAVDVVYTWVNGDDPDYQALCRRYARDGADLNPERFRDAYTLLRYSLRSLELYVPWVRHVYLFTCRPQVPAWLNRDHPRLRVVHHDEIADPEFLPTFNCNVIESYLHRIPNPSDWLLYLNDDFLFGRASTPLDFFAPDGRIRVFGTLLGERFPFRVYHGRYNRISLGFIEHAPILIRKPFWEAMQQTRVAQVQSTRGHRFREDSDLRLDFLYRYYLLACQRPWTQIVPFFSLLRVHQFHKITNHPPRQRRQLAALRRKRPIFYCLNDDQRLSPNREVVAMVRDLLVDWYPAKSSFEL